MTLAGRPCHTLRAGLVAALVALVAPRPVTLDQRTTGNDEFAERLRHMTGGHGHLGLAVGLVDGATGQAAGVGLTGCDPDTAVTAVASFEIGSVTTVFNGMLLADMVADGRITPETTLRELYPGTRFADPEVAGITLAELASHRADLPVAAPDGLPGLLHAVRANWTGAAFRASG